MDRTIILSISLENDCYSGTDCMVVTVVNLMRSSHNIFNESMGDEAVVCEAS